MDPITGEPLPPPDQTGMDAGMTQPMDQMPQDQGIDQQLQAPPPPSTKDVKKEEI